MILKSTVGSSLAGAGASNQLKLTPLIFPVGDSRGAQQWVYSTDIPGPLSRGDCWRVEMRSCRVRLDHRYTMAKSGDSIEQILDRLINDTPNDYGIKPSQTPPGIARLLAGTNTANAYTTDKGTIPDYVAWMLSNMNKIMDWLAAHGHGTCLFAEWPRGQTESPFAALLTPDAQKVMYQFSEGLRKIKRPYVKVVDVMPRMIDMTKTDYTPLPNILNGDYLHNSNGSAEICCQESWDIPELFGLPEIDFSDLSGAFNTNADLSVLGGTLGTNAVAGSDVPLNYTLSAGAGLSVAGKQVQIMVRGKLRTAYRMTVTGTPTSANSTAILRQSGLQPKMTVGDTIEGRQEVFVGPGAVNFASPGLMLDTGVSATRLHGGLSITGDYMMPPEVHQPYYGVPRTAYGQFNTLPATLSFQFGAYFTLANVASNLVMYIMHAKAGKS